ncbi:hypothetical protein [Flavobacterium sp. SM2513]|uniref:hypothetical protein n=1 Tax=Flavobacterium sp. SM2513 TaxID=3424766 RepID=UPI003D7FA73E
MKHLHLSLYLIFVITASIVLLNRYTDFHLSDYRVHFFFLFFAASSFVVIVGHLFKKLQTNKSIIITFVLVGTACFLKAFITWSGDWKTQTVLYRNIQNQNKTIDVQMRANRFQFGYNDRVIAIYDIAPFMQWTSDIDTVAMDKSKWKKVDLQLNEMNLPTEK